ncbi:MAG: serine hydrolase [Croceitalea sp.]|nr:serine hydrolase [Croceitalea sp.]
MKINNLTLIIVSFWCFACTSSTEPIDVNDNDNPENTSTSFYFPPIQSSEWETISPAELTWNTANEEALFNFLETNQTKAFIILKDGKIAVEWYFGDHDQNTTWYWASAGKTLTAFTVGLAEEDGLLNINDTSSLYLGEGWTSLATEKENLITLKHQLTMTTGLDDQEFDCVTPDCLHYIADAGARWAYHNGPYTLLQQVVANASSTNWSSYFNDKLRNRIGMDGFWFSTNNLNNVYFSTARSMARFGLLNLNNGKWGDDTILSSAAYISGMKNTSQDLNKSYGYLWWLNGKDSFRAPASQIVFNGPLITNAPNDLYAGLGKNDQKLYIVPSRGMVIIRMGEDTGDALLGPSSFDNSLWEKINDFIN